MPANYKVFPELGYVLATYEGTITQADVTGMFHAYQADPAFDPALGHLVDLTPMQDAEAGFAEMFNVFSMFARAYEEMGAEMRCAICADNDIRFGLARMFENLAEPSPAVTVRLFDRLDAARAWLTQGA